VAIRTKVTTEITTITTTATATATLLRMRPARQRRRLPRRTLRPRPRTTPPKLLSMRSTTAATRMPLTVATRPTSRCISNGQLPRPVKVALLRLPRVPRLLLRLHLRAKPHHHLLLLLLRRPRRPLRPGRRAPAGTARYVFLLGSYCFNTDPSKVPPPPGL
jgi:hypothetical protein